MKPIYVRITPLMLALALVSFICFQFTAIPRVVILPTATSALIALDTASVVDSSGRRHPIERGACLRGVRLGNIVLVVRLDSALTESRTRASGSFITEVSCPSGVLGFAHNHPDGVRCFFQFPGTDVPTSDLVAFDFTAMDVDIIQCGGDRRAWALHGDDARGWLYEPPPAPIREPLMQRGGPR